MSSIMNLLNEEPAVAPGTPASAVAFRPPPTEPELLVEGVSLAVINLAATATTQPSTLKPPANVSNVTIRQAITPVATPALLNNAVKKKGGRKKRAATSAAEGDNNLAAAKVKLEEGKTVITLNRCHWSPGMKSAFIKALVYCVIERRWRSDSGYHPRVWTYCEDACLEFAGGFVLSKKHLTNKLLDLKADYKLW